MNKIKTTILQLNIEWGSPEENISKAERLIDNEPDCDLYVLPEMWATGFATNPVGIAEEESTSISLNWMKTEAVKRNCAISGSLAILTDDGIYHNRHYFVNGRKKDNSGNPTVSYYDKHHLFTYGHENLFYEPGRQHTIVRYEDFYFLLLTCYDLRFPVWSRYTDSMLFDAIICVANWPESRQNAWQILTRARAIENQAFLIASNRVGDDNYCHYRGQSAIINPIGRTLASCPSYEETYTSFILDKEMLLHQRSKFQVLNDQDSFILK